MPPIGGLTFFNVGHEPRRSKPLSSIPCGITQEPLITIQRLKSDPLQEVFTPKPSWAESVYLVPDEDGDTADLVHIVGGVPLQCSTLTAALLWECTRFPGSTIKMDANAGKGPDSRPYHRFSFSRTPSDLVPVPRVTANLGAGYRAQPIGSPHSVDPEMTLIVPGPAKREARALLMKHVCLSCADALAGGDASGEYVLSYLANLTALFAAVDGHAD